MFLSFIKIWSEHSYKVFKKKKNLNFFSPSLIYVYKQHILHALLSPALCHPLIYPKLMCSGSIIVASHSIACNLKAAS